MGPAVGSASRRSGGGVAPRSLPLPPALGMLALAAAFGLLAIHGTPDGGSAIGIWPTALASSALMISRGPSTGVLLALVFATAFLTIWVGRPPDVALGLAIGIA